MWNSTRTKEASKEKESLKMAHQTDGLRLLPRNHQTFGWLPHGTIHRSGLSIYQLILPQLNSAPCAKHVGGEASLTAWGMEQGVVHWVPCFPGPNIICSWVSNWSYYCWAPASTVSQLNILGWWGWGIVDKYAYFATNGLSMLKSSGSSTLSPLWYEPLFFVGNLPCFTCIRCVHVRAFPGCYADEVVGGVGWGVLGFGGQCWHSSEVAHTVDVVCWVQSCDLAYAVIVIIRVGPGVLGCESRVAYAVDVAQKLWARSSSKFWQSAQNQTQPRRKERRVPCDNDHLQNHHQDHHYHHCPPDHQHHQRQHYDHYPDVLDDPHGHNRSSSSWPGPSTRAQKTSHLEQFLGHGKPVEKSEIPVEIPEFPQLSSFSKAIVGCFASQMGRASSSWLQQGDCLLRLTKTISRKTVVDWPSYRMVSWDFPVSWWLTMLTINHD